MEVKHKQINDQEGSFYVEKDGHKIAESRYQMTGRDMDLYHTEVQPEYEGQHIGEQLVEAAVKYAREQHIKIDPSCRFARAMFGRHKEYSDVQAKS